MGKFSCENEKHRGPGKKKKEKKNKVWRISFRPYVNDIREIIRKLLDYLRILISPGVIASRSRAVGFVWINVMLNARRA